MLLMDLPAILLEEILVQASLEGDMYSVCRLREVNRYFDLIVTKAIADHWFYKFIQEEPRQMVESFRKRLINLFLGNQDRGSNELQSLMHMVIRYLASYSKASTGIDHSLHYWRRRVLKSLNRCQLCDSSMRLLRFGGYDYAISPMNPKRLNTNDRNGILLKPTLQEIRASSFMIAVITEDSAMQSQMLADGFSPFARCPYLGYPLHMACRLGLEGTTSRLLEAGARDDTDSGSYPTGLIRAIQSNHVDVVRLLLHSHQYPNAHLDMAANIAVNQASRKILEIMASIKVGSVAKPFIKAAAMNGWDDILQFYMVHQTKFQVLFAQDPWAPVLDAIKGGYFSTSELLIKAYGEHATMPTTNFAHLAAATTGNIPFFEYHLQRATQSDTHSCNKNIRRSSPLELRFIPVIAAMRGHTAMLHYALDNDYHHQPTADTHTIPNYAFITAIYHGQCDTAEILIHHFNLDVNMELRLPNGLIMTPLLLAIDAGSVDMALLLLDYGARVDRIAWHDLYFSQHDRADRCKAVCKTLNLDRKFSIYEYVRWEYKVHRREVDKVLCMVQARFPYVQFASQIN